MAAWTTGSNNTTKSVVRVAAAAAQIGRNAEGVPSGGEVPLDDAQVKAVELISAEDNAQDPEFTNTKINDMAID